VKVWLSEHERNDGSRGLFLLLGRLESKIVASFKSSQDNKVASRSESQRSASTRINGIVTPGAPSADVYGSCAPVKSQTRACPFATRIVVGLAFGVWIVPLVIRGSILIMTNPNANMMRCQDDADCVRANPAPSPDSMGRSGISEANVFGHNF
jgi:hypothetical protein